METAEHFEDAAAWLSSTPAAANLSNDTKLEVSSMLRCAETIFNDSSASRIQIYGLYKVATVGPEPYVGLVICFTASHS
jgi:hypothetical protein